MAVRHGYGKIAGTDALVFAYDTGDTRNSYRGEPTTNLVTNGNFSNGSTGWAYNGSAASYSEVTTFEGRTVFKSNGLTTYFDRGYIYQVINVTSGQTYTISFDYYLISGQLTYDPDGASNNNATFTSPTGEWKTHTDTFTAASSTVVINWWGINGNPGYWYITNIQCEQKSHKTPFVNGTRSATQGLLDLTGNSTLDLSNVSFDSNAQPTWDGTNDQIAITGFTQPTDPNIYSVEAVVKLYAHNPGTNIGSVIVNNYSSLYGWIFYLNGPLSYLGIRHHDGASGGYDLVYGTGINLNQFYHIVATDDKTTVRLYLNGTQVASRASATALNYSGQPTIGQFGGNFAVTDGDIPVVKIYNRALTADEVRNNYHHYKTRFNI